MPQNLSECLEAHQHQTPQSIIDRKIHYHDVRYDIGAGQPLTRAFSKMSHEVLKDTDRQNHGIHGLRHSYAQDRLDTLIRNPAIGTYEKALEIVSGTWSLAAYGYAGIPEQAMRKGSVAGNQQN